MTANDGRYPDESPVLTPYPLTPGQAHGDRAAWPWLPGRVLSQCGPDEWEVIVLAPGLGRRGDGTIPPPGTPRGDVWFPTCYRDASELRPGKPACGREHLR